MDYWLYCIGESQFTKQELQRIGLCRAGVASTLKLGGLEGWDVLYLALMFESQPAGVDILERIQQKQRGEPNNYNKGFALVKLEANLARTI